MKPLDSPTHPRKTPGHNPALWSVAMTDAGLVCGKGSVLARMTGRADGAGHLALDADKDRLLAMLSVVAGKPVPAIEVLRHVEAASAHWQRGDKALANLRLIFARLPRPGDPAAVDRLALTETILDDGLAPASLMKALWPQPAAEELRRYNPDQPRVPAGNGVESGRWEFWDAGGDRKGRSEGARIVVAANAGGIKGESFEEEKLFELRERLGETTPEEEVEHGRPIDLLSGLPRVGGFAPRALVEGAAKDALDVVGPGRGAIYGSKVHTEMKNRIDSLRDPNISTEQSYLKGNNVGYGTRGSVRMDAIEGDPNKPSVGYDLKTGSAKLTQKRIDEIRSHLPEGHQDIPIIEIKP